jgi:hypothetical protein
MLIRNFLNLKPLLIMIICIVFIIPIVSYSQTNFDSYHPPFANGKWNSQTIRLHIVPYMVPGMTDSVDIADAVFRKAVATWNVLLDSANIPITIEIEKHTPANSSDTIGNLQTTKNLCGISNHVIPVTSLIDPSPPEGRMYFRDEWVDFIGIGDQIFRRKKFCHIELNAEYYKIRRLGFEKTTRTPRRINIYLAAVHEIGHLLGMSGSHEVPPSSIMNRGGIPWIDILENYDNPIGENIPIQTIDRSFMRAIYPQFLLTSEHQNDTCLPQSSKP